MTTKKTTLKSVFLTGLLVLVPLAITLWVLGLVIGTMDQTLLLLPLSWQPERVFGFHLPGLGAVLTLAFIFIVGLLTQNFVGQKLVGWWDVVVRHIPVVGPLYTSVKQVSDTLAVEQRQRVSQGAAGRISAVGFVHHRLPDRNSRRRRGQSPDGRSRERLRADHAESHLRLLPDDAEKRSHRARHVRRCCVEVHRLDGRSRADMPPAQVAPGAAPSIRRCNAGRAAKPLRARAVDQ